MTALQLPTSDVITELRAAHRHFAMRPYDRDTAHQQYDEPHARAAARWYIDEAEPAADREPTDQAASVYSDLANVLLAQYDYLVSCVGIDVQWTVDDPYKSSQDMIESVAATGQLRVFKSKPGMHALWTAFDNDIFRAVHDLLGHCTWGNSFGPKGEDSAYRSHAATIPLDLLPAVAAETRGQNSAFNYGPAIDGRPRNTFARQSWQIAPDWVTYWNI